jgi:hypothetical protein
MDLPLIMISMANAASKPRGADIIAGMRGQIGIINSKDDIEIFPLQSDGHWGSGMVSSLLGSHWLLSRRDFPTMLSKLSIVSFFFWAELRKEEKNRKRFRNQYQILLILSEGNNRG